MPKLFLHIGTEKTGSTSLQSFLSINRNALKRNGVLYPNIRNYINHEPLAAYAIDANNTHDIHLNAGVQNQQDLIAFRKKCESEIDKIFKNTNCSIWIISSEHFHSRLSTISQIKRLKNLLNPFFSEIHLIVYIRRQDRMAVSLYSSDLLSGSTRSNILPDTTPENHYFNYESLIDKWASVFGNTNVQVRRYPNDLRNGSINDDFCELVGVEGEYSRPKRLKESIEPRAQEYLRMMNENFPVFKEGHINPARGRLSEIIGTNFTGEGQKPRKNDAIKFLEMFQESNENIRKKFFPDSETLFDMDFSDYPTNLKRLTLSFRDSIDITKVLWNDANLEILYLNQQRSCQYAEELTNSGHLKAAIKTFEQVIRYHPDSVRALIGLTEAYLRSGDASSALEKIRTAIRKLGSTTDLHVQESKLYRFAKDFASAETAAKVALNNAPDYPPALRALSLALERQGRYEEAVAVGEQAFEKGPGDPVGTCKDIVRMYKRLGNEERARYFENYIISSKSPGE